MTISKKCERKENNEKDMIVIKITNKKSSVMRINSECTFDRYFPLVCSEISYLISRG